MHRSTQLPFLKEFGLLLQLCSVCLTATDIQMNTMRIGNKEETRNKVSIRLGSGSNRNTVVDDETNGMLSMCRKLLGVSESLPTMKRNLI